MSKLNKSQKCIMCFATMACGKTLFPNSNIQTKSMINFRALLDYSHMNTYNQINGKLPCINIIHFYIIA